MAQLEDEGVMFESPSAAACTPTNPGAIHGRDTDRGALSSPDPKSSKVATDISSSQPIILPRDDSMCRKFDVQSGPPFHNSGPLSLIRVRSGQDTARPILPTIPKL